MRNRVEEMQGQEDINHMTMPGWPRAVLIMIHSHLVFAFFKTLFNRPAQNSGLTQIGPGGIGRSIREGIFDLAIKIAAQKEPQGIRKGKSISGGIDPKASELGQDRAFSPFGQDHSFPAKVRSASDIGYGLGTQLIRQQPSFFLGRGPGPE